MAETENDPDNLEAETPAEAEPTAAVEASAPADEPAAAAADAPADDVPADEPAADDEATPAKAPAKRRRTPKAKATAEPAAEASSDADTAADTAADDDAEPAKPKRARRKPAAAKAAADEPAAAVAETADDPKPKPRRTRKKAEPEKPAKPAAKPRRGAREYGDNPPMVNAHAKYVRTSARKARLVCDHIRGKSVEEARAILAHASRDVARDWSKLLESAVANAEHNHELIGDELRIAAVKADEGPTLKRFRPRAMGRATKIRKRTSHLSITLTPKDGDR
jgi:ribosomal protein L22